MGVQATNKIGVFLCNDNSWTETGITWDNAPSISGVSPLVTVDVASDDKNYDFNVTSALKGKSMVSLVLKSVQSVGLLDWVFFDSKEGLYEQNSPQLVVGYSTPPSSLDIDPFMVLAIVVIIVTVLAIALTQLRHKKGTIKQNSAKPPLLP